VGVSWTYPGHRDLEAAITRLASRLPPALVPMARLAFDLRWSWTPDGPALFAALDEARWQRVRGNPVRQLREAESDTLERAAADPALVERIRRVADEVAADRERPARPGFGTPERPVAFCCAEFGLHPSLPIYSGGLGVLAGDICKAASDLAVPMVAVGLLYRNGFFHQRIDPDGHQHEYWVDTDPARTPCVLVCDDRGEPVTVRVPIGGEDLTVQVWRLDVGRVPLYLLDSDVAANSTVGRWVTSRLYDGNRQIRLAQYAVLGLGGARALAALGVEPGVWHLNEGHAALAAVGLVEQEQAAGATAEEAWDRVGQRVVFTTHTPVPAGNETYDTGELLAVLGPVADLAGDRDGFVERARVGPDAQPGLTPFALRVARSSNGVSRLHGEVARQMWQPLFGSGAAEEVPITHVTNGVHTATWLGGPMRQLLDAHLGEGWVERAHEPATWDPVEDIDDAELWAARNAARDGFVRWLRRRATEDRLRRGEDIAYAQAAEQGFAGDRLTVGFARRLASYKRLYLFSLRPERSLALLDGDRPLQFVFGGKAHPSDEGAKGIVRDLFRLKRAAAVGGRVAFVEDYDLASALPMVSGCDVWVNVPRPPQEASGTSGMKSALNGGLNLSVLDGWWAEAYDGTNGWAIDGTVEWDDAAQDQRHADLLLDLLEHEVVPLFHDRGDDGVPHGWVAMIKASLRTNGPRYSAARMVAEYAQRIYPT
jgi:glycogen phosphorylase